MGLPFILKPVRWGAICGWRLIPTTVPEKCVATKLTLSLIDSLTHSLIRKPVLQICAPLGTVLYLEELELSSTQVLPLRNSHSKGENRLPYK